MENCRSVIPLLVEFTAATNLFSTPTYISSSDTLSTSTAYIFPNSTTFFPLIDGSTEETVLKPSKMLLIWNPSTLTSSEIVIPDVSFSVAFSVGATVGNVVVVSSFDIVTFSETPALSTPFKTAFTVMVCSPA